MTSNRGWVFSSVLRVCLSYLRQLRVQKYQGLEAEWADSHAYYLPEFSGLQSSNTTESEIGVGVYRGDIVTFHRMASGFHHWEVRRLQPSDLCHMSLEVPAKLCQTACYVSHQLCAMPENRSSCLLFSQQPQDSRNSAETELLTAYHRHIQPCNTESSNEALTNTCETPPTPEQPPEGSQKPQPSQGLHLPDLAHSHCGLYGRCQGCVNNKRSEHSQESA